MNVFKDELKITFEEVKLSFYAENARTTNKSYPFHGSADFELSKSYDLIMSLSLWNQPYPDSDVFEDRSVPEIFLDSINLQYSQSQVDIEVNGKYSHSFSSNVSKIS